MVYAARVQLVLVAVMMLSVFARSRSASADFVTHNIVEVFYPNYDPDNVTLKVGNGVQAFAQTAIQGADPYFPPSISTSYASAGISPSGLLRANASATASGGPSAVSYASAGYQDTITVTGGIIPTAVRLNFGVDGALLGGTGTGSGSTALVNFNLYPSVPPRIEQGGFNGATNPGTYAVRFDVAHDENDPPDYPEVSVLRLGTIWDSFTSTPDLRFPINAVSIAGTFHMDVAIDSLTHQGDFALVMSVYSVILGQGYAAANFDHTLNFLNVTLTDGTSIDPANLRFDSGLTFDAKPVPEPSSLCLLTMGTVSFGLLWLRRSKATKRAGRPSEV